ncbi:MAG TPA: tripartite tricarboxylate transporter substrate binding protein [Burkholderiales bacterium]|nr:tripartite tricarboxylate transporter substrate binding protein [Burkholderiales bacterium]
MIAKILDPRLRGGDVVASAVIGALLSFSAAAQTFPTKPIRIVVPFPAGGGVDATARTVGQKLSEQMAQPVVIENRAGAAGTIGADHVAKAAPDGHVLLVAGPGAISVATLVFSKLPYVPTRDLAPVSTLVTMPYILVIHPSLPANNAKELIALAKANPGKLIMASGGAGTGQHLAGELFNMMAGVKMLHVPYKGTAPAIADIMGGHAAVTFSDPSVLPQVKSGKLKAIGVSGTQAYPPLPNAPVIAQTGLPGYDAINWYPMLAPGQTPKEIVARLNAEVLKALKDAGVREKLMSQGLIPGGNSPGELAAFIRRDTERWAPVVKATGVKLD